MASLEKLSKALEALKNTISSNTVPLSEDPGNKNKEKVTLCTVVAEMICSAETKTAPNFTVLLSYSMETLFLMCDDQESNVRMVADESLNKIIRSLMDGHVSKVNLELHAEIKKNRNARSLRSALTKFSELAQTIRPNMRKVYMQNLVECIIAIAKRPEESVLETLAISLGKFLIPLGCFLSDSEVKDLLQIFMKNIGSENAVFRRTAALSILSICLNCTKSQFFIVHTINTLLECVIPVKEDQNVYTILGVLNCIRGLLGFFEGQGTETGLRGSFGLKRKQKVESSRSIEPIIQIFELCLYWTQHQDHNIVTAALETLNELLTSPPPQLVPILLSPQGISRSRIHSVNVNWKFIAKTLSDIRVPAAAPPCRDISCLELDDVPPHLKTNLSGWLAGDSISISLASITTGLDRSAPPSINQDSILDYPDSESVMSDDFGPTLSKTITSQTPEHDLYDTHDSPSPPLDSSYPMAWDIGELTDCNQSPLLFMGRRLVTAFLIPESCGSIRVSVRSLAITCLTQVVKFMPDIFFQPVDKTGLSTPKGFSHICDVVCFANHSDQQLRGLTRLLVGQLIFSLFSQSNYGPQFTYDELNKDLTLDALANILITGIEDESPVIRHSLSALILCLPDIMNSRNFLICNEILDKLLAVSQNTYWLVKVKLIELLCSIPFQCVYYIKGNIDYQSKVLMLIIEEFLANEDNRVRKTACEGILKLIKNVYFPIDYGVDDVVVARGLSLSSKIFSDTFQKVSNNLSNDAITDNTLSRVVNILVEALVLSSSRYLSFGCIEALCFLSEEYPPSRYPVSWLCCVHNEKEGTIADGGLFSVVVTLLTKSPVSLDLECHQWLLKLASNLFLGLQLFLDKKDEKLLTLNGKLKDDFDELLVHTMRLMNIFVRTVEGNTPVRSLLSSPLRKKPTRSTSPSKIQTTPEKEVDKEAKVRQLGEFGNSPHCLKLLTTVRSGYTNYKLTLDRSASEKFLSLLSHTLGCFEVMLSPNSPICSENIFEELLKYLRITFVLDGEGTVKVVYQLLWSLFESNLLSVKIPTKQEQFCFLTKPLVTGYYENILQNPLYQLSKQCEKSLPVVKESKSQGGNEEKEKSPLSQAERETLASRIKLFENIVIQSLREYTVTCNVRLQAQVLRLLTLLVQLKVNYCLLDSEKIFFDFVLRQFEYFEAGQIHNAEVLIPAIFQFLVYLSNEKNHSNPIISMPKIIQLCDGLMASGQNPSTHCIPALLPVVEHVFFKCPITEEVEIQKEYLLAMLLRLAEYPQVLEVVDNLMKDGLRLEDNWARWHKQTIDAILPLLAEGRLLTSNLSFLHSILSLNKSYVAPLTSVLTYLFSPQQEEQALSQWLGMVTLMLMSVCMYDEDKVLTDFEKMNLYVREEGDDPLKVKPVSNTLPPQSVISKLLFRVLTTASSKLKTLILSGYKDENIFDLEKAFSNFLLCCVLMLQPGRFPGVSNSFRTLLKDSNNFSTLQSSFEIIGNSCQIPILLWAQILYLLDRADKQSWLPFMINTKGDKSLSTKLSLNEEFLRRGIVMLYSEYLAKKPNDFECLHWFLTDYIEDIIWYCHERPVEKLLSSIFNLVPNSKLLLECTSECIKLVKPVFTHRLLHTLEYIHSDFSGAVLKLVSLSLIEYTNIAIARLAATFCCRTIEIILTSENPAIKKQLTEEELRHIFKCLSSDQRQFKRHNNLIILLNKLGKQNYNISLCEFDDCVKPVSAELVRSINLDKSWFFAQVKDKCCNTVVCDSRKCAYLLNKLDSNDIQTIMALSSFDMNILEHCFSSELESASSEPTAENQVDCYNFPLYKCAQKILLKKVKEIYKSLPNKYQIFDPNESVNHELFEYFSTKEYMTTLLSIIPALKNYLHSLESASHDTEHLFDKNESLALSRIGVLCVEAISWIVFQMPRHELNHWPSIVQSLLECSAAVFKINFLSSLLTFEQISSICSSIMNIFKFVTGEAITLKDYKSVGEINSEVNDIVLKTALKMTSIISWIEKGSDNIPKFILFSAKSIVISLGRNHKLNWLCRIPIETWQPPLDSPTPPTISVHLLHDTEILNQIVSRIYLLGWTGKFQFEESWVCLLGALSPNPDVDNIDQEEISAIMQANSIAVDGITWLVMSTLCHNLNSANKITYLHIPRQSNEKIFALKNWKRLAKMNDILCSKLKRICGDSGIKLIRIDQRPNLERADDIYRYGFAQMSVSYLQTQIKPVEDTDKSTTESKDDAEIHFTEQSKPIADNGVDIRSCVQFILDLFSQWTLANSGISLNLQLSMIKSILCISDMFTERSHFDWMFNIFLDLSKTHPTDDEIMHQYLVIGIAKASAVLSYFEGERGEKVIKVMENALKSKFRPMREAGIHGILYLLQGTIEIEKSVEEGEVPKLRPQDFQQTILQLSINLIENYFHKESSETTDESLLLIALIFYLMEYYQSELKDTQELIKSLMNSVKSFGNGMAYRSVLQGFERLILIGNYDLNDQITRLALDRFSQSDPNITIPALQLLLACVYARPKNNEESEEKSEPWTIEIMEKITALFDRIKKGYPIEVEIVCDILPGILSDFFPASDILTKVIAEFLSPNQPHKRNMAAMVFQVISQACSENQLPLLQDWVVYSLNNLTHNLPIMMAGWSLCCFFISASSNPWLKAIFPLVQSRIRQCEYEDRQILCLSAVDFYSQLNTKQKEIFLESIKNTSSSGHSPFSDIVACL